MNTTKQLLKTLALAACATGSSKASIFNEFNAIFQEMERTMAQSRRRLQVFEQQTREQFQELHRDADSLQKSSDRLLTSFHEDTKNKLACITIKGLELPDKDPAATIYPEDNRLVVQTPQVAINIASRDRLLSVELTKNLNKTLEKNGSTSQFFSRSSSETSHLLTNCIESLNTENVNFAYDPANKILTISIQTTPEKEKGIRIPITSKSTAS